MATINNIRCKLVRNATETAEKAPYIGMAIPVGSLAYDNIINRMLENKTFTSKATARYLLNAVYEYAAEKIAADVVRINLGTVSIYPMISGSFDTEDAAFDPKRNTLYVGASCSRELRDAVAGISPSMETTEGLTTVVIDSVMDIASQQLKIIDGVNDFRIAGRNLTVPDREDESLALYDKTCMTKVCDVVVSETDDGQRITCHLAPSVTVPKGVYKLRLASHGADPTDPLAVVAHKVTLVNDATPPTPTLTGISPKLDPSKEWQSAQPGQEGDASLTVITGTGLAGCEFWIEYDDPDPEQGGRGAAEFVAELATDTRVEGTSFLQADWNAVMQVKKNGVIVAQHAFTPVQE